MKTSKVMSRDIKWCTPECTVKEAVKYMQEMNCGAIPIVNNDDELKIQGIVTDRDIALYIVSRDKNPKLTRLKEFMSKDVITCNENDDINELVRKMINYKVRRIPVVNENNRLVGMVSLGDIAVKTREEHETFNAFERISEPVRV